MRIDLDFIKEEIKNIVDDKLSNMCNSEISEELYEFLKDKTEIICKSVYEVFSNNERVVNTEIFYYKALDGFNEDLILNWEDIDKLDGEEREREIQSVILYNYDALWMTAIHKAFPKNTSNTQLGYGTIELIG